jgi:Ribbon-helix-helix protein, copG family
MTLKPATFRLEIEILAALEQIRARDGVSVSEQVRRALKQWIAAKGVRVKAPRRGARTPRRS